MSDSSHPSVFRRSLPLVTTSLINKCGNIGLSLLPMLLIQRQFTEGQSSLVMSLVKGVMIVGVFLGGWLSDRGMKRAILLSFCAAGAGLAAIPYAKTLFWMALAASLAQLGQVMFQAPAKLMVTEFVEPREQPESFAWLRTANNLGQVLSYSIGAIFSSFGIPFMMFFDSTTSWLAAGAGLKLLPSEASREKLRAERAGSSSGSGSEDAATSLTSSEWMNFALVTLMLAGFNFLYDLYMIGVAGKCELVFGSQGLRIFSQAMVMNCLLCSVFSIFAARFLENPSIVFPLGTLLCIGGLALSVQGIQSMGVFYFGCFLITASEIVFFALAQTALIRTIPGGTRRGSIYSISLVIQNLGRILGGALAFSWVVYATRPLPWILGSGGVILALVLAGRSRFISIFKLEEIIK